MKNSLTVKLKNCFGINKLDYTFEFTEAHKTFSIYAQNGSMKTCFAKTFECISKGEPVTDLIFEDKESEADIKFNGTPIDQEVLVINSYSASYTSEKVSTLLANKQLQDEFNQVNKKIDNLKNEILNDLKKISKINKLSEIEEEVSKTFYNNDGNKFFEALERIEKEVNDNVEKYTDVKYKDIFDTKITAFLKKEDVQRSIKEYIEKYDELLDKSTYFKKGIFNHSQAEDIAKNLNKNGFFKANHAVLFGENTIATEQELTGAIENEKNQILGDESLKNTFNDLDRQISANQDLKGLREFLSKNSYVISELSNLESFKAKLWKYYLSEVKDGFNKLIEAYQESKKEIARIIKDAQREQTDWLDVINIFNDRFIVPFRISISNKVDVILKMDAPSILFEFVEGKEKKAVEQNKLLTVLSQGEKRALYLLNIIFEIEARKKSGGKNLFIIDDIADSFDYKNKYAIIEYLRDISKTDGFYQIILSHNFDFHRTISSRLPMERQNKLSVIKTKECIEIKEEIYQHDPFTHWRKNLDNDCFLVAAIPFVRNLAEYSGDEGVSNELTKFLHVKADDDQLDIKTLKELFSKVLQDCDIKKIKDDDRKYKKLLENAHAENAEGLEGKITKAIVIRLNGERFIISKINDNDFVNNIEKNQTSKLIDRYKILFPEENDAIKVLDKIQLMTPESIHVNSFMYEPLLDMSNEYLDDLYHQVSKLLQET